MVVRQPADSERTRTCGCGSSSPRTAPDRPRLRRGGVRTPAPLWPTGRYTTGSRSTRPTRSTTRSWSGAFAAPT